MSAELRRNLPQVLLQAREELMSRFRPVLSEHGLTDQQWRILRTLLEHGPLEPRQLCRLCLISSPSIVGVLARMQEAGLVRRQRMDHDQRRVSVSLAPRGRQLLRQIAPAVEARYAQVQQLVGKDELEHVYEVLDRLLANLGQAPAGGRDGADAGASVDNPGSSA